MEENTERMRPELTQNLSVANGAVGKNGTQGRACLEVEQSAHGSNDGHQLALPGHPPPSSTFAELPT